mmetsp:Transcript_1427/g.2020  ORF Transcript_1427/g.2020 Transcript_1427/m.2020 type:complete len:482 (-) Transcript_1427:64-1509(-)
MDEKYGNSQSIQMSEIYRESAFDGDYQRQDQRKDRRLCCGGCCICCIDDSKLSSDQRKRLIEGNSFMQSRLWGCRNLHHPFIASFIFFWIGASFITVGIGATLEIWNVEEIISRYDDCSSCNCTSIVNATTDCWCYNQTDQCQIDLIALTDIEGPLYLYYSLEDFYQNHREYVTSQSNDQLGGEEQTVEDIETVCKPAFENDGKAINPCGLKANSVFNDTFLGYYCPKNGNCTFLEGSNWNSENIAWRTDDLKFKGRALNNETETAFGYFNYELPSIEDPDFIVWMRSGLSNRITKLYRVLEGISLSEGDILRINVTNIFSVDPDRYQPRKHIILSNMSQLGGQDFFLTLAYLIAGGIAFAGCGLFLVGHLFLSRTPGDLNFFKEREYNRRMKQRAKRAALIPRPDVEADLEDDEALIDYHRERQNSAELKKDDRDLWEVVQEALCSSISTIFCCGKEEEEEEDDVDEDDDSGDEGSLRSR